jgi:hypothetical protein
MTIRSFSLRQNPAYRPGFSLSPLAALLLVTAPVACVRRVPETVLAGAPAAPAPVVARPARWAPKPTGTAADYVVEVDGALTIDDAAGPSRDSTALRLTASVRRAAGTGFSGVVRAVTVRSPGMNTPVALPRIPLPAPYSANASIGVSPAPTSRLATANSCDGNLGVALTVLRELLFVAPDTVSLGSSWTDSSTYRTCRDGIPLDVASQRRFTVERAVPDSAGRVALVIVRRSTASYRGWGARGDDTTWVAGRASSELRYRVDAATGEPWSAEGAGSLELEVRSGTTRQRATQVSSTRIARLVP